MRYIQRAHLAGHDFEIWDIKLEPGGVCIEFLIRGPVKPFGPSQIELYGEDGKLALKGRRFELSRAIPEDVFWTVDYHLSIEMVPPPEPQDLARMSPLAGIARKVVGEVPPE